MAQIMSNLNAGIVVPEQLSFALDWSISVMNVTKLGLIQIQISFPGFVWGQTCAR
jgi:hypothetical protein